MTDSRKLRSNPDVARIDRALTRLEADFDKARDRDELRGVLNEQLRLMEARAKYLKGAAEQP